MLQRVEQSIEAQEVQIKAYDAETKRISAVQAGMTPDQIQDIVMGTIAAAMIPAIWSAPAAQFHVKCRKCKLKWAVCHQTWAVCHQMGGMPPNAARRPNAMSCAEFIGCMFWLAMWPIRSI